MKLIMRNACFRRDANRSQEPQTRKMVRDLVVALAKVHGRPAQDVSKSDWDRAKWELAGEPDSNPKEAAPESE